MNLQYLLNNGKNPKWKYWAKVYMRLALPSAIYRRRLDKKLDEARHCEDAQYIKNRVDYYCRLKGESILPEEVATRISDFSITQQKVYYFDTMEYLRWFEPSLKMSLLPGDINYVSEVPVITKSRPISDYNANNVLLNLDKDRHFIFVRDRLQFTEKRGIAIFRGWVGNPVSGYCKQQRWDLLNKFWKHLLMDLGEIASPNGNYNEEWLVPKITLYDHLVNKFVISIEGNDVASNLKWVMSSNSVAIMLRPTCETWFMEGRLIPNVHYIEVRPDFEDLPEKIQYYSRQTEEALAIIKNAHE